MSWNRTCELNHCLMGRFVLYVSVCPEMRLPDTNQQEMLENLLEFLLLYPISFILFFNL